MQTREQVLELLEQNRGVYLSGSAIAKEAGVSRAAINKVIHSLKKEGYQIDSVTNKGYALLENTDVLSACGIRKHLVPDQWNLEVIKTIDSTNVRVRRKAEEGELEGYVLAAGEQTAGRGRMGRTFYSPADTGIYLSLLLRPNYCEMNQAVLLTTMAAVAACEAIEEVTGKMAEIKWVNDIYMDKKKVCGILTEAAFSVENQKLEYVVLGAGFNLYWPEHGFPAELSEVAGSILEEGTYGDMKNRMVAAFLNRFYYWYTGNKSHIEDYRKRSFILGHSILVHGRQAVAEDLDDCCRLLVRYTDETQERLSSGEISIHI